MSTMEPDEGVEPDDGAEVPPEEQESLKGKEGEEKEQSRTQADRPAWQ
jgi:hypothetical protein